VDGSRWAKGGGGGTEADFWEWEAGLGLVRPPGDTGQESGQWAASRGAPTRGAAGREGGTQFFTTLGRDCFRRGPAKRAPSAPPHPVGVFFELQTGQKGIKERVFLKRTPPWGPTHRGCGEGCALGGTWARGVAIPPSPLTDLRLGKGGPQRVFVAPCVGVSWAVFDREGKGAGGRGGRGPNKAWQQGLGPLDRGQGPKWGL